MRTFEIQDLEALFSTLKQQGYTLVGPTVQDHAIVYDEIESTADLPAGWTDEQEAGTYRLQERGDPAYFGHNVGPHSWKRFLHPARLRLWRAERRDEALEILPEPRDEVRYAFIGVRSCDLHAIAIQDRVFLGGNPVDPVYKERRENALIVAVHCAQAGGTCFCASMSTGPKATSGYDIALTEVVEQDRHFFVVTSATDRGAEIVQEIDTPATTEDEARAAARVVEQTASEMGRALDTTGIKELLYQNQEHPAWEEVGHRCLACGNCTLVCPTCFCTTAYDTTDLTTGAAERWRLWDSCFTAEFSYLHGGSVRASTKSRYRQWMTHKLAAWIDQFGSSGCVGCGRCITWCPVGIDITQGARTLRQDREAETENPHAGDAP